MSLMLAILAMLAVLLSLLYMYGYSYKARDMLKHRDVEAPESDPRQTRRTWPLVFANSCSGIPSSHAILPGMWCALRDSPPRSRDESSSCSCE